MRRKKGAPELGSPKRKIFLLGSLAVVSVGVATILFLPKADKLALEGEVLSATSQISQVINPGTLSTDIVDGSFVPVGSPSFSMSSSNTSFSCQTTTGTLGTASQRLYVSNPGGANNGWSLTIAATAPTTTWADGGNSFDFNDSTGSGCTDGADTDTKGGQLTIDPSAGTLATGLCVGCAVTNISKGASSAFVEGTGNTLTILNAAAGSDDIVDVYLTGVGLSQKVPVGTPAGTYSINLTLTATAL